MTTTVSMPSNTLRIKHLKELSSAINEGTCRTRHYLALTREDRARVLSKLGISTFDWELIKTKMVWETKKCVQAEIYYMIQEIQASTDASSTPAAASLTKVLNCAQKEIGASHASVPGKELSRRVPVEIDLYENTPQNTKDQNLIVFFEHLSKYLPPSTEPLLEKQGDMSMKAAYIREWMDSNRTVLSGVTQILIPRSNLKTLPPEISFLSNLRLLIISHSQIETLPSEIGELVHLETLSLPHNKLKILPPEIGRLTQLKQLALADNQLKTLPKELVNLTTLQRITLKGNPLEFLPIEIRRLKKFPKISI